MVEDGWSVGQCVSPWICQMVAQLFDRSVSHLLPPVILVRSSSAPHRCSQASSSSLHTTLVLHKIMSLHTILSLHTTLSLHKLILAESRSLNLAIVCLLVSLLQTIPCTIDLNENQSWLSDPIINKQGILRRSTPVNG